MKGLWLVIGVVVLIAATGCGGQSEQEREVSMIRNVLIEAEATAEEHKAAHVPGEDADDDSPCVSSNPANLVSETERRLADFKDVAVEEVSGDLDLEAFQWCVESIELGRTLEGSGLP